MNNKRRIIGIAAAVLLALVGTASLIGYVNSAKANAIAEEDLVDVYVIEKLVPQGSEAETIKTSVKKEQVPERLRQDGAIVALDDVGDRVAATDMQPGDQLLAARLTAKGGVIAVVDDKVQVAARLDAERAAGGALQKGDLVGVYLSFEPFDLNATVEISELVRVPGDEDAENGDVEGAVAADDDADAMMNVQAEVDKSPNTTSMEFHHVLVTNVQTVNPPVHTSDDGDDPPAIEQVTGTQYVVTLALSPEESERFVFAAEFGHVWLSIEPTSVTDDGTRVVTLGEVYADQEES